MKYSLCLHVLGGDDQFVDPLSNLFPSWIDDLRRIVSQQVSADMSRKQE